MSLVQRINSGARMSKVVIHSQIAYLSGVVPANLSDGIAIQTQDVLTQIDALLAQAGTDKGRLLTAHILLRDIDRDFAGMNEVWEAWVDQDNAPARVTSEAKLARPEILVEIIVTAAV